MEAETWEEITVILPKALRMGRRFGLHVDEAYDIAMDTLLRCAENLDRSKGSLSTYSYASLRHAFTQRRRITMDVPDRGYIDTSLLEREDREVLLMIKEVIGKDDYLLLLLHFGMDTSLQTLADLMGIAKTTAWYHVQRAKGAAKDVTRRRTS